MRPEENLALVSAAPRRLRVAATGQEYAVHKLTPRAAGRMQALIMDRCPNPKSEARKVMEGLPDAVQVHIWDQACAEARSWPPTVQSPQGQAVLSTIEGLALIIELAIAPGLPGFTSAQATDLAERMTGEEFERLMELINPEGNPRPKAETPATSAPTPTRRRR